MSFLEAAAARQETKRLAAEGLAPEPKKAKTATPGPVTTPSALSAQSSASSQASKIAAPNKDDLIAAFEGSGAGSIRVGALNDLIGALYPSQADKVGDVQQGDALDPKFGMPGAYRMYSSGSNCDCLVHSFLTVTCPNFRSLTQPSKNEFASIFRRQMLPRLVTRYPVSGKPPVEIARFKRNLQKTPTPLDDGYLADSDISIIAQLFDVSILSIEPARRGYPLLASLIEPRKDIRSNPYVIYGSGAHFEGVQLADGTWQRSYDESVQNVRRIINAGRANAAIGCIYEVGTSVMFEGNVFRVIGRTFDNKQNCATYVLTNNPNLELPKGGLNEAWMTAHAGNYLIIPANSKSLGAVSRGPIGCRFEVDAPVMHEESPFRVIGRIYDDKRNCKSYVITNDAALQPPAGGLNDRWLASHAAQIRIVPADTLSGAIPTKSLDRGPIGCRFEVDASVMYEGSRFRVIGRIYDDKRNCVTYVLTKNAALQAPAGGLNDRWLASHAAQISIAPADSISGARGGRTRRRINRKRKTRKYSARK